MMDNMGLVDTVVSDWKTKNIPEFIPRDQAIDFEELRGMILTVSGPRRAGKTYFLYQLIADLRDRIGIDRENIFYVNLEDDRLHPYRTTDLDALIARYQEMFDINRDQDIYLFLDEIQNIDRWSAWVRRVHDLRPDIRIIISGSSSKLLSTEIATNLRGRTFNVTILPVSYREFLRYRGIEPFFGSSPGTPSAFPSTVQKIERKKAFNEYLELGGFPQITFGNAGEATRRQTLQEYFEVMLLRDVIERYQVRNPILLRTLARVLVNTVAKEFSFTKTRNTLRSMGIQTSTQTIIEYVQYFEDAFVFFTNPEYHASFRNQLAFIKKVYCIDLGLANALAYRSSEDRGWHLENLVYIELLRRKKAIFYHRNTSECDFVIQEGLSIVELIQVCADMTDPDTRKREIKGLVKAMNRFELTEGLILTEDEYDDVEMNGKTIHVRPVWYWLQDVPAD
jgi:uncharacterized protein